MPRTVFAVALALGSVLFLTRTGACCVEASSAALWTGDAVAAKRLLNSLQACTGTPGTPFLVQMVRQSISVEAQSFSIWLRRSCQTSFGGSFPRATSRFIVSLFVAHNLAKAIAEALGIKISPVQIIHTVLEHMRLSTACHWELALTAPVLVDIMNALEAPEEAFSPRITDCISAAIAELAAEIQLTALDCLPPDSSIAACAAAFQASCLPANSGPIGKLNTILSMQALLADVITCAQELVRGTVPVTDVNMLAAAIVNSSTPRSLNTNKTSNTTPMHCIFLPFGASFLEQSRDSVPDHVYRHGVERLLPWNVFLGSRRDTLLMHRIRSGDASGWNIDDYLHLAGMQNSSSETALMLAVRFGRKDVIPLLIPLEAGYTDLQGNTALTLILSSGDPALLTYISELLPYEQAALRRQGFTDLMLEVITAPKKAPTGLSLARKQTVHGFTALILAVMVDNAQAVAALAPREAGMRTRKFKQAGSIALELERTECIDILLEYEDIRDESSNTALHRMARQPLAYSAHVDLNRYHHMFGLYNGAGHTALMLAALSRNVAVTRALVGHEGNMVTPKTKPLIITPPSIKVTQKEVSMTKATAFVLCIQSFEAACPVEQEILGILAAREGITACANRITPLMVLAILNKPHLYELCTGSIGERDSKGKTALMYAAEYGAYEMVALLVDRESGRHDFSGWTALLYAVRDNSVTDTRLIAILAQREGHLGSPWNWSSLTYAVHNNNAELTQLLLQFSTPEQIAQARGYLQIRGKPAKQASSDLLAILNIV